jgi:hypothetical protein
MQMLPKSSDNTLQHLDRKPRRQFYYGNSGVTATNIKICGASFQDVQELPTRGTA